MRGVVVDSYQYTVGVFESLVALLLCPIVVVQVEEALNATNSNI